jgi:hypothetical protein
MTMEVGMAKLIYSAIASLDGYIEDEHGKFDWAAPVVGGGKRALPDNVRVRVELLAERRFRSGVVHLHYEICV